ncbi:MAG: signal recognition particle-docking protein FtsY [Bdellovibrionota bacterium]
MNTPAFQDIVFGLGTFGLILAFLWLVLRKKHQDAPASAEIPHSANAPDAALPPDHSEGSSSWWKALTKTRSRFTFVSKTEIQDLKASLEEACLVSDLGVQNTEEALSQLNWPELAKVPENERLHSAKSRLGLVLKAWLASSRQSALTDEWPARQSDGEPTVLWFVGVNGVGKTTSIAKLASELKARGFKVMLAAGDTFRAAAGEQLETWAQRLGVECVRGAAGADSSSVLFDAIQSARAKKVDFVLCDSAGRLHNQNQLMDALTKNKRVMAKALSTAPHETLLVLDAHTGQNMLPQAKQFQEAVGLSGLVLTKLDGSARGGAVVAVARQTGVRIRRLGLGETEKDFVSFEPDGFVDALLGLPESTKVLSDEAVQSL